MNPTPALDVFFHWSGDLASASFYVPYRGMKNWAWETYCLVGGFFSCIIVPWPLALTLTRNLTHVLHEAPAIRMFWACAFGVLWGLGGLSFGLTMRYLGVSFGDGRRAGSGLIILSGVGICLLGIAKEISNRLPGAMLITN